MSGAVRVGVDTLVGETLAWVMVAVEIAVGCCVTSDSVGVAVRMISEGVDCTTSKAGEVGCGEERQDIARRTINEMRKPASAARIKAASPTVVACHRKTRRPGGGYREKKPG